VYDGILEFDNRFKLIEGTELRAGKEGIYPIRKEETSQGQIFLRRKVYLVVLLRRKKGGEAQ